MGLGCLMSGDSDPFPFCIEGSWMTEMEKPGATSVVTVVT